MACELVVYEPRTKQRQTYTCDEENLTRIVEDDHAAQKAGDYKDVNGRSFHVDWTTARLVSLARRT